MTMQFLISICKWNIYFKIYSVFINLSVCLSACDIYMFIMLGIMFDRTRDNYETRQLSSIDNCFYFLHYRLHCKTMPLSVDSAKDFNSLN